MKCANGDGRRMKNKGQCGDTDHCGGQRVQETPSTQPRILHTYRRDGLHQATEGNTGAFSST